MSQEKVEILASVVTMVLFSIVLIVVGYFGKKHSSKLLEKRDIRKPTRSTILIILYNKGAKFYFIGGIVLLSLGIVGVLLAFFI